MALAVFPERMNPIDPEDVEVSLRTLERYIQYMTERVEFVLSKNFRTTTELGETSLRLDGDVSELADDLDSKVDREDGKGLSTEDYTTAEKAKLAGIEDGAQANVVDTVKRNGTALPVTNKAVDVTVPTAVSELTNDSGYQTAAQVQTAVSDYLPLSGGTMSGNIDIKQASDTNATLRMYSNEDANGYRAYGAIYKSANSTVDNGVRIADILRSTDGQNNRMVLVLKRSNSLAESLLFTWTTNGSNANYYIYGTHNPPGVSDIDGIEQECAKLSNQTLLSAGANLNTLVTPGTYMTENGTAGKTMLYTPGADATTHLNSSIGSFVIDVRRWDTAGRLSQTLLTMRGAQYHRYTTSGTSASPTWTEWTQMA